MAHLVRHHLANFGQRALIQQIVIKSDSSRASQPGNVCTYSLSLSRLIDDINLRNRNLVRPRQREDWITNLWIGQRGILVKDRFDQNRRHYTSDGDEDDSKYGPPYPPGSFCRLKNAVENGEGDSQNDDSNRESVKPFAKPCSKGLIGHC